MEYVKKIKSEWLVCIALLVYAIVTLYVNLTSGRICWFDEAHAWTISANCDLIEIFKLMKIEGHTILWYVLLKPFALIFRGFYPYPMLILNWFFACAALFIMAKKAPFNNIIKILIIFSSPMFYLYIYQARCYTLTIFMLFSVLAFYKERINHPYKYLMLLILSANTSLVGAVPAFYLGILFLIDLYKASYIDNIIDKNIFGKIIIITEFAFLYMYLSFSGLHIPDYNVKTEFISMPYLFRYFFLRFDVPYYIPFFKLLLFRLAIIFFTVNLFFKSRYAGFFWLLSAFTQFLFFSTVYSGRDYHIVFIFIYAIMAYWLYIQENTNLKNLMTNIVNIVVFGMTLYSIFLPLNVISGNNFLGHNLLIDKNLKNSKLFAFTNSMAVIESLPEMEYHDLYFYDMKGRNISKYEGLRYYYRTDKNYFDVDELSKYLDNNRDNYLVTDLRIKVNELKGKNVTLKFEFYDQIYVNRIYKISKIKKNKTL